MILCVMMFPPSPESHGGSQRAWYLLSALCQLDKVHFVLLHPPSDRHANRVGLQAVEAIAESVTQIPVPEWDPIAKRLSGIPRRIGQYVDLVRFGTIYAPRLPKSALAAIAAQLPSRDPDVIFAGRLPVGCILQQVIDEGLLSARARVIDFDDVQSSFLSRELTAVARRWLPFERAAQRRFVIGAVKRAEAAIASRWDAVSVCSDEDVVALGRSVDAKRLLKVPNVIDKPLLPPRQLAPFNLLFVGNLGFGPNLHGLEVFVREAWPLIVAAASDITMTVVGLNISTGTAARLEAHGIACHSDVPDVMPYYASANAVIAPIFFGGGTRVKILEAMAYGRPVIATPLGVEGLDLVPGRHALVAADMKAFAAAAVTLARDPDLAASLARQARTLQQSAFGPAAMKMAVARMIGAAHPIADPHRQT